MATGASPTPIELPVPGGKTGATVELVPLLAGEMLTPPGFLVREPGRLSLLRGLGWRVPEERRTWIPVPAFLIRHPAAGPILVDTGFHPSIAVDPSQQLGFAARFYRFRVDAEQALPAQLRQRGIEPSSIGTIVMTHLHLDHASAISEFPGARFVLGQGEWAATRGSRGVLRGYVRRQLDHAVTYVEADYGRPNVGSYATFGRSVDLFGDGSVRLCYTPGHTHGHQSVIVRLRDREVLLTGDAAYLTRNYTEGALPLIMADEHRYRVSAGQIRLYAEQNPDALVIPGHDPEVWTTLQASYS